MLVFDVVIWLLLSTFVASVVSTAVFRIDCILFRIDHTYRPTGAMVAVGRQVS